MFGGSPNVRTYGLTRILRGARNLGFDIPECLADLEIG
jgi:hypothetical protein